MSFGFRKSIKLAPGVRINFNKRSTSLTAFGATLSSRSRSGGSRRSTRSSFDSFSRAHEAERKRTALENAREEAESAQEADEEQRAELVNVWRDLPDLPSWDEFERMAEPRPFDEPAAPVELVVRRTVRREKWRQVAWERWVGKVLTLPLLLAGVFFLLMGFFGATYARDVGIGIGVMMFGAVLLAPFVVRQRRISQEVDRRIGPWSSYWAHLLESQRAHVAAARLAWEAKEAARTSEVRKLMQNEPEALNEAIARALEEVSFPFEMRCTSGVQDGARVFILVDLPEIEDVIPEIRVRALRNGTTKEVRRTAVERNNDYAQLVIGIALAVARVAHAAAPAIGLLTVAAYTQRRQSRTGRTEDEFVYEFDFTRELALELNDSVDPIAFARRKAARINLQKNGELRAIDAPGWASDLM